MGRCTGPSKEKEHKLLEKMKTQIAFLLFALLVGVSGKALQNVKAQDNAEIQAAKVSDALAALDSGNDRDDEDAMMAADPEPLFIIPARNRHWCHRQRHGWLKCCEKRYMGWFRWRTTCKRLRG